MATDEFYRDERPEATDPGTGGGGSWFPIGGGGTGIGGGGGGGVGVWHPIGGGGGGGDGSGGDGGDEDDDWHLLAGWALDEDALIIVNGENLIMTDGTLLLTGPCCMRIEIEVQIKGEHEEHLDCIIVSAVANNQQFGAGQTIIADFLASASIDIYARWQKGHWDHSEINTVRFRLRGDSSTITPWYHVPMGDAPGRRVMTLDIRDGLLSVGEIG